MKQPLAFRMRPEKLEDILGQHHLLDEGMVLRRCMEQKQLFSMIFFGPPGTGKTTLATVLANEMGLPYRLFNAVTGNKKDLETIFEEAKFYQPLVVIIDEVHRLNKDKQDLLLPHVENGNLIMIGATTSNPYFAINPAIRSRCHLFEIKSLTTEDIILALHRALKEERGLNNAIQIEDEAAQLIADHCSGDLRYALNILEIASLACQNQIITKQDVLQYSARPNMSISKGDDGHYDAVSAFQKSIRGSDVQASLYYLARLIAADDLDSIERRLLVIAYEDIGLANPGAVSRTIQAIDATKRVGFPEGAIILSNAVVELALSPKSRSACSGIHSAMALLQQADYPVPEYLRLTPVNMQPEDKYDYDRSDLWYQIQYLPNAIKDKVFYTPSRNSSYEKQLAANYDELVKIKRTAKLKDLKNRKK